VTTGIRQILDKYELLEKVGQGGMAIVYRGLDTTLRRQVAVKVLHRHLADHKEARDRFEREAQAVAKLRHENILEIFDFSGVESEDSYIVTEFIDGQTLKQFISEHQIRFPEIGAMITVQVCRALSHAHSLGVLHRDVKPENIMIRNDGVVKLTDFGIAQMLDHHRLTVTGQLLGSPAYMAPEHVEGGKLDFRTDVFAAGVVLYQLTTGELPFRGKNAHEILKRIAECSFTDPRQMNPLIGNELGGIIRKALAHDKDARYADVSQMVAAIEGYLSGSGLATPRDEVARFFNAPVSYEMALRPRLVAALTKRGLARLTEDRNAALEIFNRVLTMDPDNAEVLSAIERMSRQRRWLRATAVGVGLLAVAVGGFFLRENLRASQAMEASVVAAPPAAKPAPPRSSETPRAVEVASATGEGDAAGPPAPTDAPRTATARRNGNGSRRGEAASAPEGSADRDAAPEVEPERGLRRFEVSVFPRGSELSVDGGPARKIAGPRAVVEVGPGASRLQISNPCCTSEERVITPGEPGGPIHVDLEYRPGYVTPRCPDKGVTVTVAGESWELGREFTVPFDRKNMGGTAQVKVSFLLDDRVDDQTAQVKYGEHKDVTCRF
jgi:tRNA A-37 threonylcarbamoyl transferase component Bud32